jgi:hypothetical protein
MKFDNGIAMDFDRAQTNTQTGRSFKYILGLIMGGALVAGLLLAPSASAEFNHVFVGINGDTTLSTMTQGDEFYWGSNCDSGSTINWEVWFDANSNSSIDPASDALLTSENITDGDALTEPDPILDGYALGGAFNLSAEPGLYIFKATDIEADSSLLKVVTMVAMSSPPNQLTGQIILPGISAPNALLANAVIFAESDTGDEGAFLAVTDNMGMYSMNVGADGTGVVFYLDASNVTGYVTPDYIWAIASGVVTGNDFTYVAATDSVWGFVRDELGVIIPWETSVSAQSNDADRRATTSGGRYVIYFSDSDGGEWSLQSDSRNSPVLLSPDQFVFDLDAVSSFQHDITLTRTDAMIYARVTENGGPPSSNYRVDAYSYSLGASAESVSGTGSDNIATLHVSTLDPNDWQIWINQWDYEFPIPFGFVSSGDAVNVAPGDTVTLNLVEGKLVSGTITQDPEDAPIFWDEVYVSAGAYGGNPDGGGGFSFYASPGLYSMGVWAPGYLTNPMTRSFNLVDHIFGGLDFTINEAHHTVSGTLVNVSLPLDNEFYTVVARTGTDDTDGYFVTAQVDAASGTFSMNLCDGNWTFDAPWVLGDATPPDPTDVVIGEAPDNSTNLDLVYVTGCCASRVGDANNSGDDVPTIGDVSWLIDALFISVDLSMIECLAEADINQSGGADPQTSDITIGDVSFLIDALFISVDLTMLPDCL